MQKNYFELISSQNFQIGNAAHLKNILERKIGTVAASHLFIAEKTEDFI
jgi:hypothetical protein